LSSRRDRAGRRREQHRTRSMDGNGAVAGLVDWHSSSAAPVPSPCRTEAASSPPPRPPHSFPCTISVLRSTPRPAPPRHCRLQPAAPPPTPSRLRPPLAPAGLYRLGAILSPPRGVPHPHTHTHIHTHTLYTPFDPSVHDMHEPPIGGLPHNRSPATIPLPPSSPRRCPPPCHVEQPSANAPAANASLRLSRLLVLHASRHAPLLLLVVAWGMQGPRILLVQEHIFLPAIFSGHHGMR
jgi:hypothetical protein